MFHSGSNLNLQNFAQQHCLELELKWTSGIIIIAASLLVLYLEANVHDASEAQGTRVN